MEGGVKGEFPGEAGEPGLNDDVAIVIEALGLAGGGGRDLERVLIEALAAVFARASTATTARSHYFGVAAAAGLLQWYSVRNASKNGLTLDSTATLPEYRTPS